MIKAELVAFKFLGDNFSIQIYQVGKSVCIDDYNIREVKEIYIHEDRSVEIVFEDISRVLFGEIYYFNYIRTKNNQYEI